MTRSKEINLNRSEICDLMLACAACYISVDDGGKKWKTLHNKLEIALQELDNSIVDSTELQPGQ